jgi:hypothetical protein
LRRWHGCEAAREAVVPTHLQLGTAPPAFDVSHTKQRQLSLPCPSLPLVYFFNVFFQLVPELPGQTIPTRPLVLQAAALLRRDFITAMAAWPSARLARFPSRAARTFRYRLGDLLGLSGTLVVCAF